uniref:Ig-like domain-containing protein n=1 Tax=Castor canadensis TaxID=51338 RepID=A0A8C0WH87_CASCN
IPPHTLLLTHVCTPRLRTLGQLHISISLLTFWNLPTTAQLTIESVPANAAEGSDVLLRVHNLSENLQAYYWYKGESAHLNTLRPGSVYSGRETIYPSGSLLFRNVTQNDMGFYTLRTLNIDLHEELASVQLFVFISLLTFWHLPTTAQLTTESVPANAAEGSDVLLRVHNLPENLQGYYWYKGESAMDNQETIYHNGSLLLEKVTQKDIGFYTLQKLLNFMKNVHLCISLLSFWNLLTTAQLTIESVPANAAEGSDVLLRVHNSPENLQGYYWYKGESAMDNQQIALYVIATQETRPGSVYSGREMIYHNGSLLLQNVTQKDTGFYTLCTKTGHLQIEEASVQLFVFTELPKPFITSTNSSPVEGKDSVALMCEPETPDTTYLWWINGHRVADSDSLELSKDNRTLTLLRVTRNDTGNYECGTRNPVSANRSDPVTLNVLCE